MGKNEQMQLGFDGLFAEAEAENEARRFRRETAELPDDIEAAFPFLRDLIAEHDATMRAGWIDETMEIRERARKLARKLNAGATLGLIAPDSPWRSMIARLQAEHEGAPRWGLGGSFEIAFLGVPVRIEMEDMLGIGASSGYWLGFAAHAVDAGRPFVSETGYRSVLGCGGPLKIDIGPEAFVAAVLERHVETQLSGRLVTIDARHRMQDGQKKNKCA